MVIGTSLAVGPFNMLPNMTQRKVPKVLMNLNNTKESGGLDFTEKYNYKCFVEGKCDDLIYKLVEDCGWS